MWILFTTENLRALIFKSSKVFLKRPPGGVVMAVELLELEIFRTVSQNMFLIVKTSDS